MMWCQDCKRELRNSNIKCPFCDTMLTTMPQGKQLLEQDLDYEDKNYNDELDHSFNNNLNNDFHAKSIEPVLLMESADQIIIDLVCNMLKENSIPFYVIDKGVRSYNKVALGGSVFAAEVYVDKPNFEKAKELVDIVISPDEEMADFVPLKDSDNKSYHWRIILLRVIIAFSAFLIVTSFIISAISHF